MYLEWFKYLFSQTNLSPVKAELDVQGLQGLEVSGLSDHKLTHLGVNTLYDLQVPEVGVDSGQEVPDHRRHRGSHVLAAWLHHTDTISHKEVDRK